MMRGLALVALFTLAACPRHATPAEQAKDPEKTKPAAKPKRPAPAATECVADADCALLPEMTCCGECAVAPPFEAVTRAELDATLIESDEQCATEDWDCDQVTCTPVPAGCTGRAACDAGRCVAVSDGC